MSSPAAERPAHAVHQNEISHQIIGCAIEVRRSLGGPGLLEAVYEEALAWELTQRGLQVQRQVILPIKYKDVGLRTPLKFDLLVEGEVIVECKATEHHHPVFEAQALTYLRLTGLKLALVISLGEIMVKDGIRRVARNLPNEGPIAARVLS